MDYETIVGATYGRLLVVAQTGVRNKRHEMIMACSCTCGGQIEVPYPRLKSGNTKSCGCLQPEVAKKPWAKKHGQCYSSTYGSHRSMMKRCYDPGNISYRNYGAKGITVCPRWRGAENFPNFLADMGGRPAGHTLERRDYNGNYTPDNCRWATPTEQARNTCTNRWFTLDGETQILKDWSDMTGVSSTTILDRLSRGWGEREAILTPPKGVRLFDLRGETLTLRAIASRYGTTHKILQSRIDQGWTLERAVSQPVGVRYLSKQQPKL